MPIFRYFHNTKSSQRDAGYKDVNQFMKAFEKSCRLLEEYQKASEDKTQDDPKEKESVLSKLKAYEEEAKHRPSKSKSKHKRQPGFIESYIPYKVLERECDTLPFLNI